MIEVCFTEEEFKAVEFTLNKLSIATDIIEEFGEEIYIGINKSLETANKPMLYTSENKQRVKE